MWLVSSSVRVSLRIRADGKQASFPPIRITTQGPPIPTSCGLGRLPRKWGRSPYQLQGGMSPDNYVPRARPRPEGHWTRLFTFGLRVVHDTADDE